MVTDPRELAPIPADFSAPEYAIAQAQCVALLDAWRQAEEKDAAEPQLNFDTDTRAAFRQQLTEAIKQRDELLNLAYSRFVAFLQQKPNREQLLLDGLKRELAGIDDPFAFIDEREKEGIDPDTNFGVALKKCALMHYAAAADLHISRRKLDMVTAQRAAELGHPVRLEMLPVGDVTKPLYFAHAKGVKSVVARRDWRTDEITAAVVITPPPSKNGNPSAKLEIELGATSKGKPNSPAAVKADAIKADAIKAIQEGRPQTALALRCFAISKRARDLLETTLAKAAELGVFDAGEFSAVSVHIPFATLAKRYHYTDAKQCRRDFLAAALELFRIKAFLPPKEKGDPVGGGIHYLGDFEAVGDDLELSLTGKFIENLAAGQWTATDPAALADLTNRETRADALGRYLRWIGRFYAHDGAGYLRLSHLWRLFGYRTPKEMGNEKRHWARIVKEGEFETDVRKLHGGAFSLLDRAEYWHPKERRFVTSAEAAKMSFGDFMRLQFFFELNEVSPTETIEDSPAEERPKRPAKPSQKQVAQAKAMNRAKAKKAQAKAPRRPDPENETPEQRKRRIAQENAEASVALANIGHRLAGEPLEKVPKPPKADPEDSAPSLTANSRDYWGGRKFADLSPEEIADAQARGILLPD